MSHEARRSAVILLGCGRVPFKETTDVPKSHQLASDSEVLIGQTGHVSDIKLGETVEYRDGHTQDLGNVQSADHGWDEVERQEVRAFCDQIGARFVLRVLPA